MSEEVPGRSETASSAGQRIGALAEVLGVLVVGALGAGWLIALLPASALAEPNRREPFYDAVDVERAVARPTSRAWWCRVAGTEVAEELGHEPAGGWRPTAPPGQQ